MSYREILYRDYSAHFGSSKRSKPELQFSLYAQCYRDLPASREAVIGDLGCGQCEWLLWLRTLGYTNLWGVDYSEDDLRGGRERGLENLAQGDALAALKEMPARFDLLHAKDVVEHLTRDELFAFLEACRRALKPGGHLWLLTFNAQSPLANAVRYGDLTHELGLTPNSMAQALRAAGFQAIGVHGIHICPPTTTGRLRSALYRLMKPLYRFSLALRSGAGSGDGFDPLTVEPDLFATGQTPKPGKVES